MDVICLNNVGRKFRNFINTDETSGSDYSKFPARDFWALRNIDMTIHSGEIVGVIGRNGAGKSTLLNIIAGVLPPSEGEMKIEGKVSALLTLGAGFQEEFTGKENIYLNASLMGVKKQEADKRFMSILEFSELGDFINAPLGSYSNGMKMRLGFSVAIHNDFDILATDEIIMVGDIHFQKKCFGKMLEFKRLGKTMFIVSQDMAVIKNFCDRVYLLENGKIDFNGDARCLVERYEMLLNKKRILSEIPHPGIVRETRRWAADMVDWGKREGTGEVLIKEVMIKDKWGKRIDKIKVSAEMNIAVEFEAKEEIDNYHFGVAIFRDDGVYCYGPNTKFDGLSLGRIKKGKGFVKLKIKELLLMPGFYYFSVAIWYDNEKTAYDYHKGSYKIEVTGEPMFGQLLFLRNNWIEQVNSSSYPNLDLLVGQSGTELKSDSISLESVRFLDGYGNQDTVFVTGKEMKIKLDLKISTELLQDLMLWVGIYRTDGIYCHGSIKKITSTGNISKVLVYPKLLLLPGGYTLSIGLWDSRLEEFLMYSHGIYTFNMIAEKQDHGTVYLEHHWDWKIP